MSELSTLTADELTEIAENESVIKSGLTTFVDVGNALAAIKNVFVRKPTAWASIGYSNWEDYCSAKWGMSRPKADFHIAAAATVKNVGTPTMVGVPSSERQIRPLAKLPAEQQPAAWERATEIAKEAGREQPTAKHVEQAVEEVKAKTEDASTPDVEVIDYPSKGLHYAEMALSDLAKIQRNDSQRKAAFNKVIQWINNNK